MTDDDALMHAITGEPAPDTPELRAAHDDIAALRRQLTLIADELDKANESDDPPVVVPLRRRSPRVRLVLAGVAAAGVLGMLGTGVALLSDGGGVSSASDKGAVASAAEQTAPAPSPASTGLLTDPEYLACAATVVEGTVSAVRVNAAGETEATLRVTRAYKPVPGPADVTFVAGTGIAEGDDVLLVLGPGATSPDETVVGAPGIDARRPALTRALTESRALVCHD